MKAIGLDYKLNEQGRKNLNYSIVMLHPPLPSFSSLPPDPLDTV